MPRPFAVSIMILEGHTDRFFVFVVKSLTIIQLDVQHVLLRQINQKLNLTAADECRHDQKMQRFCDESMF